MNPFELSPASQAARRGRGSRRDARARAYPPLLSPNPSGELVVLEATRALLSATSRAECAQVLHTAINDLGGGVVPARLAGSEAIQVDVSLGADEPHVVVLLDPEGVSSMLLSQFLPGLHHDARLAAEQLERSERAERAARIDELTGAISRAELGRKLGSAQVGDVVCALDLDKFKALNDTQGHAAGDTALREFGGLLLRRVGEHGSCGRVGGDEFVVILEQTELEQATRLMEAIVAAWRGELSGGTSVSVGVARVLGSGRDALERADAALYRAKRSGRNRVELDDEAGRPTAGPTTVPKQNPTTGARHEPRE